MYSPITLLFLGTLAFAKGGVLYHRQHAAAQENPDYLDDVRLLKVTRTLVPVALPSVQSVSTVPAAVPALPAVPAGPVVLATPQFLLPRVALIPQGYPSHLQQYSPYQPQQLYSQQSSPQLYREAAQQYYREAVPQHYRESVPQHFSDTGPQQFRESAPQQFSQSSSQRYNSQSNDDYEKPFSRQQIETFHYTGKTKHH